MKPEPAGGWLNLVSIRVETASLAHKLIFQNVKLFFLKHLFPQGTMCWDEAGKHHT